MALARFDRDPELMGFWDKETLDQEAGTRYYRRINVEASCLACHGRKSERPGFIQQGYPQDLAYDFRVGDLRGMYAVFIPDAEQHASCVEQCYRKRPVGKKQEKRKSLRGIYHVAKCSSAYPLAYRW